MVDGNFQNDFFGGKFNEKKSKKSPLMERYSRRRILPHIRIPVEHIVMIAIGILVLVIVSFAVGVERGKRIAAFEPVSSREAAETRPVGAGSPAEGWPASGGAGEPRETAKTVPETAQAKPEEKIAPEPPASVYIIQLASFKNRYSASEEIDKLKQQGIDARLARAGAWYQVHAAGYQTIDEARKAKKELREVYPDCYIRKVR